MKITVNRSPKLMQRDRQRREFERRAQARKPKPPAPASAPIGAAAGQGVRMLGPGPGPVTERETLKPAAAPPRPAERKEGPPINLLELDGKIEQMTDDEVLDLLKK